MKVRAISGGILCSSLYCQNSTIVIRTMSSISRLLPRSVKASWLAYKEERLDDRRAMIDASLLSYGSPNDLVLRRRVICITTSNHSNMECTAANETTNTAGQRRPRSDLAPCACLDGVHGRWGQSYLGFRFVRTPYRLLHRRCRRDLQKCCGSMKAPCASTCAVYCAKAHGAKLNTTM